MEKIVRQGLLYDFYGELLTDHQKQVYESVVYENLSLGEIADEMDISRQAVHDLIKRTDKILEDYESKLGLIERFDKIRDDISDMEKLLEGDLNDEIKTKLKELCESIKDRI
jgi:predicted DNA-binding protein YlxM (UPF0122 family)